MATIQRVNPIAEALEALSQYWVVEEPFPIQIVLGAAAASFLDAMLWIRIIGASRSGKSVVLKSIGSYPDFKSIDVITPGAARGGYRGGGSLEDVMRGKRLLVIKDIASFSNMPSAMRSEVWALLRVISDGELTAVYGSDAGEVHRAYQFNMLIGTVEGTVDRVFESQHGQRFIDVGWDIASPHSITDKIAENRRQYGENFEREVLEPAFTGAIHSLIDRVRGHRVNAIIPEVEGKIGRLAEQVAILRGNIPRNRTHEITGNPQIEVPSTLASSFTTLASGICMTRLQDTIDWTVYNQVLRVARDSVPPRRRKILAEILQDNRRQVDISRNTGLSRAVVNEELENMRLLGVPDLSDTGLSTAFINGRNWRDPRTGVLDLGMVG